MLNLRAVFPIFLFLLVLVLINGCKDEEPTGPIEKTQPNPPNNVLNNLYYVTNEGYYLYVVWEASIDEDKRVFTGYAVVISEMDFNGDKTPSTLYKDSVIVSKWMHGHTFGPLERGKHFRLKLYAINYYDTFSEQIICDDIYIKELAPPVNANVELLPSEIKVSWTASTDENSEDFFGYAVATYEVTSVGGNIALVDSLRVAKPSHSRTMNGFKSGKYYRTYIWSKTENEVHSPALETHIYSPVTAGNGVIDEFYPSGNGKSGYGWNSIGAGVKYSYTSANSSLIDIHCRKENGSFVLYSPTAVSSPFVGARTTKFVSLSSDDWDKSSFSMEPNKSSITIAAGDVILLKNQDNYYIKLKIISIAPAGSNSFATITFDYRFQTMQGLRVAKQ